ncbi:YbaB/EbfC family nucleoid-associated protein [Nocardia sp. CDC153]|uniref:YbaB/EbfC family nucleoid-associated protein n=1 Tax=Nocardia sp. CDC153 TaxID=3112167 RepID=UPI002DBA93E6|nr:YbaB/EbfC family nucleoid-associated protein [Nocardia sp. CDC153]MEC3957127.1 YbaB/EbfC family nucleoid-associated protein [Nocardia sp. CDC153]
MSSQQSRSRGYSESLATKMDRVADALSNGRAAMRAEGVYVDVYANGHVRAIAIDDEAAPRGAKLGPLIADLINKARDQAQQDIESLVQEVQADPRIATIVEQIGDAPERSKPTSGARPQSQQDEWDEDENYFHRGKSRILAPKD